MTTEETNMGKLCEEALNEELALCPEIARERLLAHIAALTAERDEARHAVLARFNEATEAQRERDALRERVQVLEEERTRQRDRANTAESRLAAIRQRSRDMAALEHIAKETRRSGSLFNAAISTARYVVGDDTEPVPQTDDIAAIERWRKDQEAKAHNQLDAAGVEKADDGGKHTVDVRVGMLVHEHRRLEALTEGLDDLANEFGWDGEEPWAPLFRRALDAAAEATPPAAPPEAFAHGNGLDAGAFDDDGPSTSARAPGIVSEVKDPAEGRCAHPIGHGLCWQPPGHDGDHKPPPNPTTAEALAALADAPFVFTLEEVEKALVATGIGPAAREQVRGCLESLRRKS